MRLVVNLVLPIYHVVCVRLVSSYRETFAYCPYDTFLERGESYDAPSDSGLWAGTLRRVMMSCVKRSNF